MDVSNDLLHYQNAILSISLHGISQSNVSYLVVPISSPCNKLYLCIYKRKCMLLLYKAKFAFNQIV